jgi:hypothetical protein
MNENEVSHNIGLHSYCGLNTLFHKKKGKGKGKGEGEGKGKGKGKGDRKKISEYLSVDVAILVHGRTESACHFEEKEKKKEEVKWRERERGMRREEKEKKKEKEHLVFGSLKVITGRTRSKKEKEKEYTSHLFFCLQ